VYDAALQLLLNLAEAGAAGEQQPAAQGPAGRRRAEEASAGGIGE
jgi:hypothetical protein